MPRVCLNCCTQLYKSDMDFDGYCELSSDDDENAICCSHHYSSESASDDDDGDLSTILQYSANRSKHQGQYCTTVASTDADPFEEELAGELDQAMLQLRALDGSTVSCSKPNTTATSSLALPPPELRSSESRATQPPQDQPKSQYDSIYFDSDEDDDDAGVQNRRATQSNSDLLYDPSLDDLDQQWMDHHRAAAHRTGLKRRDRREGGGSQSNKHQKTKPGKGMTLPDSDAVLNCPGCLTMLCADCQRHAIYSTQFRAMFVFSCKVDYTQLLRFPTKLTKKEIWKNKKLERKMRQAMKMNKKYDKCSSEENGVDTAAVKVETLLQKDQAGEDTEMECNSIDKSSNVPECCGESDDGATHGDDEPTEESKSKGMHSSDKRGESKSKGIHSRDENERLKSKGVHSSDENEEAKSTQMQSSDEKEEAKSTDMHSSDNKEEAKSTEMHSSDEKEESKSTEMHSSDEKEEAKSTEMHSSDEKGNQVQLKSSPVKKVRFNIEEKDDDKKVEKKTAYENSGASGIASEAARPGGALLQSQDEELYHPVMCQHCNTKVAVLDKDEVYHFFNVITSY